MPARLLIAYATKSGATAEIADAMGQTLQAAGFTVDVLPVQQVLSLTGYSAAVVGSAVRVGKWLPQALAFLRAHQEDFRHIPTAIFTVHALWVGDDEESQRNRAAYTNPVREIVSPVTEAFFAGRIELSRLSFMERLMTRAVKAVEADRRDWEAIAAWAESLSRALGLTGD